MCRGLLLYKNNNVIRKTIRIKRRLLSNTVCEKVSLSLTVSLAINPRYCHMGYHGRWEFQGKLLQYGCRRWILWWNITTM